MNQRSNRAASTWAWLTQLDFSTKQKRRQSEVKLVCWAAIVALVTLAVWGVGAWLMAPAGEQIRLELADAAGLQVGDPVSMRGIQIGQVQSIANETEMVVAMLRVESQAAESIPSDARFVVQSPGMISQALMGNSRGVEVVPQTDWNDVARNWIGGTQGENADVALLTEASSTRVAEVASLPPPSLLAYGIVAVIGLIVVIFVVTMLMKKIAVTLVRLIVLVALIVAGVFAAVQLGIWAP